MEMSVKFHDAPSLPLEETPVPQIRTGQVLSRENILPCRDSSPGYSSL